MTEVATVRIDEDTKRKIKRYGISVSKVARKAILEEIECKEREESIQALRRMKAILRKVDTNRIVTHIRESRTNR